eukprot:5765962-Amphidinium_carterae.1
MQPLVDSLSQMVHSLTRRGIRSFFVTESNNNCFLRCRILSPCIEPHRTGNCLSTARKPDAGLTAGTTGFIAIEELSKRLEVMTRSRCDGKANS